MSFVLALNECFHIYIQVTQEHCGSLCVFHIMQNEYRFENLYSAASFSYFNKMYKNKYNGD